MNDNNKVDDDVSFMVVNDVSGDEDPHYIHTNDGDDCGGGGGGGDVSTTATVSTRTRTTTR